MKKVFTIIVYVFAIIGFFIVLGYALVKLGVTKIPGISLPPERSLVKNVSENTTTQNPIWAESPEWKTLENAIRKDEAVIKKSANDSQINPRLIVSILIVEQLRLFHSDRELYKKVFEPLSILLSQSQFSWGVIGIKQETAVAIEKNLKDNTSEYYLGKNFENLLDFKTEDKNAERFNRIVDEHNHYFAYLYAGIYVKQIISSWQNAGFPIENKIGILATLYNLGFEHSKPNSMPSVGGARIEIGNETYAFGQLAEEFYNSNLLIDVFPR